MTEAATMTRKLRSPLKWHGGKSYLARRIIALMPPHDHYFEMFAGGLSILLNKRTRGAEMANDANADLMQFWRALRDDYAALRPWLATTSYNAETFELAEEMRASGNPALLAIGFLVRNRFSRGGLGKDFAWSDRLRGGQPGDVNAWETIRAELPAISGRIAAVDFLGLDCLDALRLADVRADTLVYADPPYLHETRTAKKAYAHEMTREQHATLLDALCDCKGPVVLSGYRSPLYDARLKGWTLHEISMPNHSGQGATKQRRVECLWIKA